MTVPPKPHNQPTENLKLAPNNDGLALATEESVASLNLNLKNSQVDSRREPFAARPWRELSFVGFDTETTGKYPLTAEICEIAAVKWVNGKVVDRFESLIKPTQLMGAEVIGIHGITNEMVADAPVMGDKIAAFRDFIDGSVLIAHHAPFDLGFVAIEMEKAGMQFPETPALCSSLLSRKLFPESKNHRLQTLIPFFNLEQGTAHRALDDARACLEVGMRCLEKLGDVPLQIAFDHQDGMLTWNRFSMDALRENSIVLNLINATLEQAIVEMIYSSGSTPGLMRRVHPMGLVRSLDGDFLVAYDEKDQRSKRYLLDKITSAQKV